MMLAQTLLVVSDDPREGHAIASLLGLDNIRSVTSREAETLLGESALAGMVVASSVRSPTSKKLVRTYMAQQPVGKVAVLAAGDDITTLTAYAFRDPRIELFFTPWRVPMLLSFLGVEAGATV